MKRCALLSVLRRNLLILMEELNLCQFKKRCCQCQVVFQFLLCDVFHWKSICHEVYLPRIFCTICFSRWFYRHTRLILMRNIHWMSENIVKYSQQKLKIFWVFLKEKSRFCLRHSCDAFVSKVNWDHFEILKKRRKERIRIKLFLWWY